MIDIALSLAVVALFFVLGRSADTIVSNVRLLAEKLGVRVFMLGILLGGLTSLPELSVGINAAINQHDPLSYGNLIGGLLVLFGLILGGSILLNRKVETDGSWWLIAVVGLGCLLPMLLGLDGVVSTFDGLGLILVYASVLVIVLRRSRPSGGVHIQVTERKELWRHAGAIGLGVVGVLISANLLVRVTLHLLRHFDVPEFVVGLLVFSLGTNLPEIIVTLRSWKRHISELSVSNLIGSVITNTLIVGLLASAKKIQVDRNQEFYVALGMAALLFISVAIFYRTGKGMVRGEGAVLVAIYVAFVVFQIWSTATR